MLVLLSWPICHCLSSAKDREAIRRRASSLILCLLLCIVPQSVFAQDLVYLQVSSHGEPRDAIANAHRYATEHPNVAVHASTSGFFAITIDRLERADAQNRLDVLKASGSVPSDAYLTAGANFLDVIWNLDSTQSQAEIIEISGPISLALALDVLRQIDEAPRAGTAHLDSDGGSVYAGLVIARAIRIAGLDTVVPEGARCFSACIYPFLAGANKQADGVLGVHQIWSREQDNSGVQFTMADILQEMRAYDAPDQLIDAMLRTAPEDIYIFSNEEVSAFGWR